VTVVNLADSASIAETTPLHTAWRSRPEHGIVIVDLHAESSSKFAFAHAHDGEVAAVLGTHTHEPSERVHIFPDGTALVIEVGMTGPSGGFGGFDPAPVMARYRGEPFDSMPFGFACGPLVLGAVLLQIEHGKTISVTRVG
jgi:calcineurin-like phosphoesterase